MQQMNLIQRLVIGISDLEDQMEKIIFSGEFATAARQMRQEAATMPMYRLWQEIAIIDEVRTAQLATLGRMTPLALIAQFAIGDELQKRITGQYPVDCLEFR